MCMTKNILASVHGISSTNKICELLELMYYVKGISSRLLLEEHIHNSCMNENMKYLIIYIMKGLKYEFFVSIIVPLLQPTKHASSLHFRK